AGEGEQRPANGRPQAAPWKDGGGPGGRGVQAIPAGLTNEAARRQKARPDLAGRRSRRDRIAEQVTADVLPVVLAIPPVAAGWPTGQPGGSLSGAHPARPIPRFRTARSGF